jgi:hypothetical protein
LLERWGHGTASYLFGDAGLLLLQWQLTRDPGVADRIFAIVGGNIEHPSREQLWGSPGTVLAALHMAEATGEGRWTGLFASGLSHLRDQMVRDDGLGAWLWVQELYGERVRYLGAGHGFAGNVYPALRGAALLPQDLSGQFEARALQTLDATAAREGGLVNWLPVHDPEGKLPPKWLVQDCHGAPGIICRVAQAPPSPAWNTLLLGAGELVWRAGPLNKGPGLCHGTAGNGYAFLKLYKRTGDSLWLERARAFAMHAIAQVERARVRHGRGRYSLWTGDPGVALFTMSCIAGDADFPTLDVF